MEIFDKLTNIAETYEGVKQKTALNYLAKVTYQVTKYMNEYEETFETFHVVIAKNEQEAKEKINKFYADKTDIYSTYFSVHSIEIFETIA